MAGEGFLERGREALRRGGGAAARTAFERAEPAAEAWEGLSAASFVLLEYARAIEEMERAYALYRAGGDGAGAARTARKLGGMHGSTRGDWAVAGGWIARAKSLLGPEPTGSECGWVALTEGMFEEERPVKQLRLRTALEIGHETGDVELTFVVSAYLGASLVHDDRTEEGMVLLDEALVGVVAGEVEDFVIVEEIFCQLFAACEHAQDIDRAEQWMRVGEQIATRRGLPAVSAYCRTHYGGILTAAGRWPEADAALTEAVRLWTLGRRTLKAGALARLAELRVRQGRYDEAAQLLEGLAEDADAARPLAALHLARGEPALAIEVLQRVMDRADPASSSCVPLLALLADAELASGRDPGPTIGAMATCAEAHPTPYTTALLALARGRLALTTGSGDPRVWLREALAGFTRAQLPLEASLCRLDLARACGKDSPAVAVVEARAALAAFERLQAARYSDAAAALLRSLGERVAPPRSAESLLTRRELEVLTLVGAGLSNPEIAERLFISRKTVEHHVGNILAKLGLRNRAEVSAYAVRHQPAGK